LIEIQLIKKKWASFIYQLTLFVNCPALQGGGNNAKNNLGLQPFNKYLIIKEIKG